jgi:hypothetical protein
MVDITLILMIKAGNLNRRGEYEKRHPYLVDVFSGKSFLVVYKKRDMSNFFPLKNCGEEM